MSCWSFLITCTILDKVTDQSLGVKNGQQGGWEKWHVFKHIFCKVMWEIGLLYCNVFPHQGSVLAALLEYFCSFISAHISSLTVAQSEIYYDIFFKVVGAGPVQW